MYALQKHAKVPTATGKQLHACAMDWMPLSVCTPASTCAARCRTRCACCTALHAAPAALLRCAAVCCGARTIIPICQLDITIANDRPWLLGCETSLTYVFAIGTEPFSIPPCIANQAAAAPASLRAMQCNGHKGVSKIRSSALRGWDHTQHAARSMQHHV